MLGYKIYYNGEKFVMENMKSPVEDVLNDSTLSWNAELKTAISAVNNLNESHKLKQEELTKDTDFLIRKCKDCNTYFILSSMQVKWFESRNLKLPCRCESCRNIRKVKQRGDK